MCSGSEAGSYLRLIDFGYHSTLGLRVMQKKAIVAHIEAATDTSCIMITISQVLLSAIYMYIYIYIYIYEIQRVREWSCIMTTIPQVRLAASSLLLSS